MVKKISVDEVLRKHSAAIESKINSSPANANYSQAYSVFKSEMTPELNKYEKWCHSLGNIIKLKISKKDEDKVKRAIEIAHLEVEPWQALTLGVMSFISLFFIGILISVAVVLIQGSFAAFPFLFFILMVIASIFLFY